LGKEKNGNFFGGEFKFFFKKKFGGFFLGEKFEKELMKLKKRNY